MRKVHPGFVVVHAALEHMRSKAVWDEGDFAACKLLTALEEFLLQLWWTDFDPVHNSTHVCKARAGLHYTKQRQFK